MELAKLKMGQTWAARDDEFLIVNFPQLDGFVKFQSKASGLIFEMSFEKFRKSTQYEITHLEPMDDFKAPQNLEEGDALYSKTSGKTYLILKNIRKKKRAYCVNDGVDVSIGEALADNAVLFAIQWRSVTENVIALGRVWEVLTMEKFFLTAKDPDGKVQSLDYKAVGALFPCSIVDVFDENEIAEVVEMSIPLPEYGHLKFWENFARIKDQVQQ